MKKVVIIVTFLVLGLVAKAEVEFAYEAGAEVVSAYLWRGIYNGGLSFQPTANIGFDHEHIQFRFGAWANVGASDWGFKELVAEVDISGSIRSHGVTAGFSHYYYCDGTNYFNIGNINDISGSAQTEVMIGLDGDDWLPEQHHAYVNWYTMVSGADGNENENENEIVLERAYSSYLELGYDYTFSSIGLTLGGQLGIVPWRSDWIYGTEGAALKCISLKLNKAWNLDVCEIDLFAQGMIDTYDIHKDNLYIAANGYDKIGQQKLNGAIGLGVWF